MNRHIFILLFCAFIGNPSLSQHNTEIENKSILTIPKAELGIGLQVLIPQGTFQQNIGSIPVGLTGNYYHRLGSRLMLGGEINIACISHNEYEVELPNGETASLDESEDMWGMIIGARFNFVGNAVFRSYTEVRGGFNSFYTSVSSCNDKLKEYNQRRSHGTSFVSSFGLGISFDPKGILKGRNGGHWITLRAAYVVGSNASYRNAPESDTVGPLNQHIYSSSIRYIETGISVAKQF